MSLARVSCGPLSCWGLLFVASAEAYCRVVLLLVPVMQLTNAVVTVAGYICAADGQVLSIIRDCVKFVHVAVGTAITATAVTTQRYSCCWQATDARLAGYIW